MVKDKHCLLRAMMILPVVGALNVGHAASDSEKKVVDDISQDLLKVVALLDQTGGAKSGILKAPAAQAPSSNIKQVAFRATEPRNTINLKELEGLDLSAFSTKPKAEPQPSKSKAVSTKKTASTDISKRVYHQVMSTPPPRKRRYRPCYQYGYQELQNRSRRYQQSITEASRLHGVNENLIKSVITAESCFKVRARSHKGARGLMQLMPATARRFGVRNSYNSHQNIRAGARYLRWLLDRYQGNVRFALAGYNAGEGKVDRYGGIPPYKETREYVRRVMGVYRTLHNKYEHSFNDTRHGTTKTREDYRRIWLQQQRLKQNNRPLSERRCLKAVPGHLKSLTNLKRSGRGGRIWRRYYSLQAHENLSHVMNKTGVHINTIKRMNHLTSQSKLGVGHKLLVWECRA